MRRGEKLARSRVVGRLQKFLLNRGVPRVQMSLMVLGTAAAGFLTSVILHRNGLAIMPIRYAIAVVVAYVVFLLFTWIWVLYYRTQFVPDVNPLDALDAVAHADIPLSMADSAFGAPVEVVADAPTSDAASGFSFDIGLDLDSLLVLVVLVVAVSSALIVSVYFVVTAPAFFAEVLLDGVFSAALYRRLKRLDQRHWLESAVVKTAFPVFWVVICFVALGFAFHWYAPEADSIGDVWQHYLLEE